MGDWEDITREIELVIGDRLNNLQSSIINHQSILEDTVEKLNQLSQIAKEKLSKLKTIPEDTHREQTVNKVLSPRAATSRVEMMHKDTKSLAPEQSKVHENASKPEEKVSKLEEVKKKKAEEAKKKKEEEENKKKEQIAKKKEDELKKKEEDAKKKEEEAKKKEESKKKMEEKKKHDELEKKSKLEEMKEKKKQEELEKKAKLEEDKRLAEEEKSKKKHHEEDKKKKQDEDKKKPSEDQEDKLKESQKSKIGLPRPKGLQAPTSIGKPSQLTQPPQHLAGPKSPSGGSRLRSASPSRFMEKAEEPSKPQQPAPKPVAAPLPPAEKEKEKEKELNAEADTSLKIPEESNERHFEEESFLISADSKLPDISYFTESPIKHSVPAESVSLSSISLSKLDCPISPDKPDKPSNLDQPPQEPLAEEPKPDLAEVPRSLALKSDKSAELSNRFQKRSSVAITLTNPSEDSIKSGFFNHRASSFAGLSNETFSRSVIPAQMSVEEIDMQLSMLDSSYSQSELTTEKRFDLSVGAKSALSLLTTMDDSKFYMNNLPSAEVIWSFRVFFRLAGRSLHENDEEAWQECREFLANARNKELNGKSIDKVVIEFMAGYDYSDENVDQLEALVFEKEGLMTPQYFTSLCPLTGLFMFALREAAIYAGVIKGKIPVARQYKRLIHKKRLIGN